MKTRIYAIEAIDMEPKPVNGFFLVEAASKATALRHVADKVYDIKVADQRTLVGAIRAGILIESAGAEPGEPEAE